MRCKLCQAMLFVVLIGSLVGCGESREAMTASIGSEESQYASDVELSPTSEEHGTTLVAMQSSSAVTSAIALNRKIIYETNIGLVVPDYKKFENELPALVNAHGGFVANNNTNRRYKNSQTGDWVVRIPVAQYASFLSGVDAIGFAETRTENAQDVTEEYVDIEARIKNKQALESRVLGILEDRSGKLNEILEIERELSRVREEIERMEGRIRFLKERTRLATVTIRCREQQEYQPAAAPTLGSRLGQAFSGSIGMMQNFVANLLVVVVAILPWLVMLSLAVWAFNRVTGQRVCDWLTKRSEMAN